MQCKTDPSPSSQRRSYVIGEILVWEQVFILIEKGNRWHRVHHADHWGVIWDYAQAGQWED